MQRFIVSSDSVIAAMPIKEPISLVGQYCMCTAFQFFNAMNMQKVRSDSLDIGPIERAFCIAVACKVQAALYIVVLPRARTAAIIFAVPVTEASSRCIYDPSSTEVSPCRTDRDRQIQGLHKFRKPMK